MSSRPTSESNSHYLRIARALQAAIEAGEYQRGERLPSVRTLAAEHDVSLMTVSSAIQALHDGGYVEARDRRGVFVRDSEEWGVVQSPRPSLDETVDEVRRLAANLADVARRLERVESLLEERLPGK